VDELTDSLIARGYRAEALHGGMSQDQRDRVMKKLREGNAELLIATDVAARGLDVSHLTHVINFDVPTSPEAYVHRVGRVGRAGREGVAITLVEPREHRLVRNIEQLTRSRVDVARVPTVADLRARRLDLIRAAIREEIVAGGLDEFGVVVEGLADEFDVMEVAKAAVKLAHQATKGADADQGAEDIPEPLPPQRREGFGRPERGPVRGAPGRGAPARGAGPHRERPGGRGERPVRLYIGAGREAGIRPQDLVGAITGEAGIAGKSIGAIEISDRFSLVEVEPQLAERVIAALSATKIKGRKVTVRRERFES
jgi:ATP-dependent RNA helicase DeaD